MRNAIILACCIGLFACGSEEEQQEVLDFEDFAGETGIEEVVDSANTNVEIDTNDNTGVSELISAMHSKYDTLALEDFHLLDRFGFSQSKKVKFKGNFEVPYGKSTMVKPTAELYYYSFADSNKTNSAFYNYLDGMASEGEGGPVKLNVDVDAIKTPPMFMLVYDTVIVATNYQCEHAKNDWQSFQDSLLNYFGENYRYSFEVDCGGPLKWKE
ncbi:hypothetical protein K6119_03335 [Paracrocinitomix mangrovi]|uniref:hypothetical protein n=1 Tax=Paracrocinitomix mangrovi TaxID=2862509 RepID=UPI001C8DFE81|nr:hypothetical protein [Paracrocinitomix mangrovi]UKN02548.1 hypothetical protein K6119_03335 [Paracrocinitomix mangrovi]